MHTPILAIESGQRAARPAGAAKAPLVLAVALVALVGIPIRAVRFPQNPIVTPASSPTLGENINGPSLIRVPPWVERPLGR